MPDFTGERPIATRVAASDTSPVAPKSAEPDAEAAKALVQLPLSNSKRRIARTIRRVEVELRSFMPFRLIRRWLSESVESERQNMLLDTALSNMAQGLAMFDAKERIVIANDRYAEVFGLTSEQVEPGTTLRQVIERRAARGHYDGISIEETYRTIRGRCLSASPSNLLNKLRDGRVLATFVQPNAEGGWVVTHHDVTERENLHALLAQQNALLDATLNNVPQGLCLFDADLRLLVCNKVYMAMYGFDPSEVKPGMTSREIMTLRHLKGHYPAGDLEQSIADWRSDPSPDTTHIQHHADGRVISVRRRRLPDGGYVVMHEDISERHQLEQNEREARELLSAVFDAAPAAIVCLDLEGRVMVWSRGAERMFGYGAGEVIGRPYPLVPEGKEEEFEMLFQRALAGEVFRDAHVQRRGKSGRLVEVSFASSAMYNRDGTIRGIAYALKDITESEKLRARLKEQHEQLDVALNNTSQGIAMFDAEQHLVVCNNLYVRMFGLTAEQTRPGTTLSQILHFRRLGGTNDVPNGGGSAEQRAGTFGGLRSGVQRLADGRSIQVSCRKTKSGGHVITHQDITDSELLNARLEQQHKLLKEQEEKLRAQNMQFDAAVNNMVQGLTMFDADRRLVICNRRFAEIYGLSAEQVAPGTLLQAIPCGRVAGGQPLAQSADELLQATHNDPMAKAGQVTAELGDGRFIAVSVRAMPGGGMLMTHQDITEQRRSDAKIVHMALHDTLTDLPNRALLNERLEHALTRVKRGETLSVLILDLDHFKGVNDTLGHGAGDKLLRMVADRLRGLVRETDTIARMGGDEFAILQVAIGQPSDATSLARRVIQVVSKPYDIDGHQVVIGTSVGIAIGPADGVTPDQLTKNADLALYRAKEQSRGTFCFFEPEMDAQMQARRTMEYDLRKALMSGQFGLHYQPVVNLSTREVTGMEALVRWHHPAQGTILPAMFIPLAEEIGFIVQLGEWVLKEACETAVKWPDPLTLSVNISPTQFRNPGLLQMVIGALASSGLAPDRLELEITESSLLGDSESTLNTLYQLRDLGVRIAMDDFGTGYSSLSYLQSFPFDKIKIDRSFVKDITEGVGALNIVRAVTAMAQGLGIATTAEGVETEEQLSAVQAEGCTEMQGFLFSEPLPADEANGFLRRHRRERRAASAA